MSKGWKGWALIAKSKAARKLLDGEILAFSSNKKANKTMYELIDSAFRKKEETIEIVLIEVQITPLYEPAFPFSPLTPKKRKKKI